MSEFPSSRPSGSAKPSDICLTLAAVQTDVNWLSADEIRGRLARLGFEGLTAQQVSSSLRRLMKMDAPPIESRQPWSSGGVGFREYRTTVAGQTWLGNLLPWTRAWR